MSQQPHPGGHLHEQAAAAHTKAADAHRQAAHAHNGGSHDTAKTHSQSAYEACLESVDATKAAHTATGSG